VRFKNESFIYHASLTLQWTPLQCGPRLMQTSLKMKYFVVMQTTSRVNLSR